jgi:hypothetical protein
MPADLKNLPSFSQLPVKQGAPPGSAWGVFGDDDEIGTWNLVTPEKTASAAQLVRKGAIFAMNAAIDALDRPLFWFRAAPRRTMFDCSDGRGLSYDEYIDNFCPQSSSQWDGHRHIAFPGLGFYNGVKHEQVLAEGSTVLGFDNIAKRGIATRGVLLDVGRHLEKQGTPINYNSAETYDVAVLEACARAQGVEIEPGDVLIIRSGWLKWLLASSDEVRHVLAANLVAPGLLAGNETAAWIWDKHIAAIAGDAIAVEAWPPSPERGFLHFNLIAGFGMNLGEMWHVDALAEDCAADGVYEFFFTSAPLNIPGGVGSPPNALAIK